MKINLIMTTRAADSDETKRFIKSLDELPGDIAKAVNLIAILQHPYEKNRLTKNLNEKIIITEPCSLSKARNIGLNAIEDGEGIICFPDDDCWYSKNLLPFVLENLEDENLDYFITGIYDPINNATHGRHRVLNVKEEINAENVLLKPLSVTIFYKYRSKDEIYYFDERFGIGTQWGSGEETDYLLNLMAKGKRGLYDSHEVVYHETNREKDFDTKSLRKYSVGFAAMIMKSLYERGQKDIYKQFKKMLTRTKIAILRFLFNKQKRSVYVARLKGFKEGIKQGKAVFMVKKDV